MTAGGFPAKNSVGDAAAAASSVCCAVLAVSAAAGMIGFEPRPS